MKYPMADYEHENRAEEDRCLNETRSLIKNSSKAIGAMIIEPISAFEN
jgi:4-aminobutyrate aminotransferase / (S)-3-amino-2-methylpropionate transaminase